MNIFNVITQNLMQQHARRPYIMAKNDLFKQYKLGLTSGNHSMSWIILTENEQKTPQDHLKR